MKEYIKLFSTKSILLCLSIYMSVILIGCMDYEIKENNSVEIVESGQEEEVVIEPINMEVHSVEDIEETSREDLIVYESNIETTISCIEGEWYRTNVATYEWARITISNCIEGESFDVSLDATYSYYSGTVSGTAQFIAPNTAVLYDEDVMDIYEDSDNDYGVYFKFENDKIIITHDSSLRMWFGGGGIATAEGTYIQGTPEYINSYDVTELYSEQELEEIKTLLGEDYEYMFVFVVEYGIVEEVEMEGGRYYKAYIPPYGAERCNILIYDDGSIYIDGSNYDKTYWFYSNTDATEMPVIE